ncbi:MAG: ABC transporter permease [Thaumarchaeota archaeon]|nr:ABC transporter permease [Nitrososphaerota archaeon]
MSKESSGYAIQARPAGFLHDLLSVAGRAVRAIPREPENLIPALLIPLFFFAVNVGALEGVSSFTGVTDYKAFQLPVAIIFAVTGVSRALALVTDITSGYFDRLLVSPINRWALLLGLMMADFALVLALSLPVLLLGLIVGVRFVTGILGVSVFLLLSGLWGLVYSGFPYAIALRTGNPAAVNTSFLLFLPFVFLTTVFLPMEALSGWLATFASYNPITYVLAGLRVLITDGWVIADLVYAFGAIVVVGSVSFSLAFTALRQRVKRN